ncbi:helix-turn-helix domain-containing protein [Indioceanicola profundi]|uniref:helix-turn-helix domain-containing protein n=1 Tax=Indioceanicola profundi TaxID=2220096 RepID=UPI000E6AD985|nr:helix-turn-helix domain-containing protein [Indioceanicola profundi]
MGLHYAHLTLAERQTIFRLLQERQSVGSIATLLGRHRSTIHREIARNFHHSPVRDRRGHPERGYYPVTAQRLADRRRTRTSKLARRPELCAHAVQQLRAGWSPQQISGRLRCLGEPPSSRISHESIYSIKG